MIAVLTQKFCTAYNFTLIFDTAQTSLKFGLKILMHLLCLLVYGVSVTYGCIPSPAPHGRAIWPSPEVPPSLLYSILYTIQGHGLYGAIQAQGPTYRSTATQPYTPAIHAQPAIDGQEVTSALPPPSNHPWLGRVSIRQPVKPKPSIGQNFMAV